MERLPNLVTSHGQRTERLTAAWGAVALALGGEGGSRLATKLSMPTSGDTLLRVIRKMPEPAPVASHVIGVDDWAKRRGHLYGTILVDLERRRVTDLLSDRTAETWAGWLRAHPTVKVVARDRSSEYARGITLGAPYAKQVADRWHLLVTLREAFQRLLDRLRPELQLKMPRKKGEIPLLRRRRRAGQTATRYGRWVRGLALYEKIHRLRRAGFGRRAIARQLKISCTTVNKYLSMSQFPERAARRRVPSMLDPYVGYLSQRWRAGCRNAAQLWREIRARGYPGSSRQVTRWVYERREQPAHTTPRQHLAPTSLAQNRRFKVQDMVDHVPLPSSRRLVWLLLRPTDQLDAEELNLREQLLFHPVLAQAQQLVHAFQRGLRHRSHRTFDTWLKRCQTSKIPELRNFAIGLRQDYAAVKAALRSPWSNGQTEGQINRLKLLKRQMYGRAKLDLLRLRFLYPT